MASIIKNNGENSMAEEESDQRVEDAREEKADRDEADEKETVAYRSPTTTEPKTGFFHIYKSGQGYWTRMGTVAGAALIILLIGNFLYTFLPTWSDTLRDHRKILYGIVLGVVAGLSLLVYTVINKPGNVDFLIATDSEMKKVNWTSRQELIGSTKIVVIFVLLITAILFLIDILFGYLFYFLNVLKQPPF